MKPPAWLLPLVLTVAGLVTVFAFLRPAPSVSTVGGMSSTLTKPRAKKAARRVATKTAPAMVHGMVFDSLTGLYVKPLATGQKHVSRKVLAAALAEAL